MAQTDQAISFCAADVEVSNDDVTYIELSGYGAAVAVSGGDRAYGTAHTFDGDTPIVKAGKRAEVLVTVRYAYTEEDSPAPFEFLRTIHEMPCGGPIYVRWYPLGSEAGNFVFSTGLAFISKFQYPQGEAASADVTFVEFEVPCAEVTKDTFVS